MQKFVFTDILAFGHPTQKTFGLMILIELFIKAIIPDPASKNIYVLYLSDKKEKLLLPVRISESSEEDLTLALQKAPNIRPNIYDTTKRIIRSLGGSVTGVYIVKYQGGIYYTYIQIMKQKNILEIDAKLTDAMILAIMSGVSVFINEDVMKKCGVDLTLGT